MACQITTLQTFTNTLQTLNANQVIKFENISVKTGNGIQFIPGATTATIIAPGVYQVHVDAIVEGAAAGTLGIQLYRNGVAMPCCLSESYVAAADQPASLGFTGIILVRPSCNVINNAASLTVVTTADGTNVTHANLYLQRIV